MIINLKTIKMEVQDSIKMQFTETDLNINYYEAIKIITDVVKNKDFDIKIDGEEIEIIYLKPDFSELSRNGRKNIAKRLHYVNKKKTRKAINTLFLVMRRLGTIDNKIYITLGRKEQEIQNKRKIWNTVRNEAQQALDAYKKEKGDFYKKNLV
jgi:hypothetical protein|tara:strand:- start:6575 stop:7033 length:459 start_codon:yes stop_codon:yes gene_type:complete